jgi:hypothetical protein
MMRAEYPHMKTASVATKLGRTERQVYNKAIALGLKKSPEYLASPEACRLRAGDNVGAKTRFRKGLAPWNKGASFVAGGRSPETRFKPGHVPHTWKPIGSERISKDGYLVRKVSDTGIKRDDWKLVHVHVWEQRNGAVPKGFALVFKDGDRKNAVIENLELVSRMELMRRNTVHRLPKEIAELAQLRGALNRQINLRSGK